MELRGFIEDLLYGPEPDQFVDEERIAQKRRYRCGFNNGGKKMIDIMVQDNPDDFYKFSLYDSTV